PFTLLVIALLVCASVSVIYAGAPPLGVFSFLSLITSIVVAYATASHFGRPERINFLITGLGVGILFTGLVALAQFAVGWPLNLAAFGTGTEEEGLGTQSV